MTICDSLSDWIINQLKSNQALSQCTVIRTGDVAEERSAFIIVVDVSDEGGYDDIPGHLLERGKAAVAFMSHITDDPDGSKSKTIKGALADALFALPLTPDNEPINGWFIRFFSPWTEGPISLDGNYRRTQFQSNMIIQSASI